MSEIDRIRNYINHGPITPMSIEKEFTFIQSHGQTTRDMHTNKYISDTRFQVEMMTLSARYLILKCFRHEMFDRYNDMLKLE